MSTSDTFIKHVYISFIRFILKRGIAICFQLKGLEGSFKELKDSHFERSQLYTYVKRVILSDIVRMVICRLTVPILETKDLILRINTSTLELFLFD